MTRREFLERSATLGAGLTLSPLMVRMAARPVGANDKIHLGLIGCRSQGFANLQAFLRNPEVDC
ncbi:MAG: twin-arginine translocation signal domain-containing protein, partial [Bacteroidales bacterium]|nr:twin-arginine translocation signal domain-containing protein [Bacteroidales bacterium]